MTATQSRPEVILGAAESFDGDSSKISPTAAERPDSHRFEALRGLVGQFAARLLDDALVTALPATWERRADQLDDARPRTGDFHGRATADELAARDRRLGEQATACREHAEFLRNNPELLAGLVDVDAFLTEQEVL